MYIDGLTEFENFLRGTSNVMGTASPNSAPLQYLSNEKYLIFIEENSPQFKIEALKASRFLWAVKLLEAITNKYIPIYSNKDNKLLYTEAEFAEFRHKLAGLKEYTTENMEVSANLDFDGLKEFIQSLSPNAPKITDENIDKAIEKLVEDNRAKVQEKRKLIESEIIKVMHSIGLSVTLGNNSGGDVELVEAGSSARGTNLPGDYDFDYTVRIDKANLERVKSALEKLNAQEHITETAYNKVRLKGVRIPGMEEVIDLDFSLTPQKERYLATEEAVTEKLDNIKSQDPAKYYKVVANIMFAKYYLKQQKAYKPSRGLSAAERSQNFGGLGGVGIENWILQNGGSFTDAAASFLEHAKGKNFIEFQKDYAIMDFGKNHVQVTKGNFPYDNFVMKNMRGHGYDLMVEALKKFGKPLSKRNFKLKEKISNFSVYFLGTYLFMDTFPFIFPQKLKQAFLKRIARTHPTIASEFLFGFDHDISDLFYTPEIVDIFYETILNCAISSKSIPQNLRKNKFLFKRFIEHDNWQVLGVFGSNIFDEENLQVLADHLNINKENLKSKLEYLFSKNVDIFKTLNFKILKNNVISMENLLIFTLYPDIQEKIINLDNKMLDYFDKMVSVLNSKKCDITGIVENILNNMGKYKELLTNLPLDQLNVETLDNLIYIMQRPNNTFNITDINDLSKEGLEKKRDEYFTKVETNIDLMSLDTIKEAIFEKKYGIDLQKAQFIWERYYYNIKELEKAGVCEKIINILKALDIIINEQSLNELKIIYKESGKVITDYNAMSLLESTIRNEYAQMYNKTLYHVNSKDITKDKRLQNVTYKGKKIQIYEVDGDFNMQVHTLGAYSGWSRPKNFLEDWNQPKIASHGICTSYIGNNQIAIARPKGPILGFDHYEENSLLLSYNADLVSRSANQKFSTSTQIPGKTLPPKPMIDSTRHNHDEMVIDRLIQNQSTLVKRKPDYVVYIVDDINDDNNFDKNNKYYEMTLQAAADFGVPIVIVDRLKYAKSEKEKCDKLEEKFMETKSSLALEELLLTYANNAVGCRKFEGQEEKEYHKIFSSETVLNFYTKIYSQLKKKCDNLINGTIDEKETMSLGENIYTLLKFLKHEKASYEVSRQPEKLDCPIPLDDAIKDTFELYSQYRQQLEILKSNNNNVVLSNIIAQLNEMEQNGLAINPEAEQVSSGRTR